MLLGFMKTTIGFYLVLALSWALPVYGVVYNQLNPSFESGLGVAYAFAIGCVVHLLLGAIWIAANRKQPHKKRLSMLLTSFCILILLAIISNGGALSKMHP